MRELSVAHVKRLEEIIDAHGWPGISLVGFPVSADRFRLGYAYRISWGGSGVFTTRSQANGVPGAKIQITRDNWYARLAFSPLIYADRLFLRFDLGFDIAFDEADPHVLRFNLGGGVDLGPVALSLELANSVAFFDGNEDFLDVLALTVRFMGERFQPYLAIGAPLASTRDAIQLFIAGGIQIVP